MDERVNINQACQILAGVAQRSGQVSDFDPNVWFPWILEVLRALMLCQPTPDEAYDYLTWKATRRPLLDWLFRTTPEERTEEHRRSIRARLLRTSNLPAEKANLVTDTAFAALDAGRVTRTLMRGAWAEANQ